MQTQNVSKTTEVSKFLSHVHVINWVFVMIQTSIDVIYDPFRKPKITTRYSNNILCYTKYAIQNWFSFVGIHLISFWNWIKKMLYIQWIQDQIQDTDIVFVCSNILLWIFVDVWKRRWFIYYMICKCVLLVHSKCSTNLKLL